MKFEPFRVDVERQGNALVVRPVGELDLATVEELGRVIEEAGTAPLLVLDLSELEFLDTSGMRFLLKMQADSFSLGRELKLVRGPEEVHRLFTVAGFADRLPLEDSVQSALVSHRRCLRRRCSSRTPFTASSTRFPMRSRSKDTTAP